MKAEINFSFLKTVERRGKKKPLDNFIPIYFFSKNFFEIPLFLLFY